MNLFRPPPVGDDSPPAAPARVDGDARRPTRFSVFAILLGVGVDFGSTEAVQRGYVLWLRWMLETRPAFEPLSDPVQIALLMTLGASCSVLGGFACGLLTPRRELFHTLVQGLLGELFVLATALGRPDRGTLIDWSDPLDASGHVLNVVVPMLGGALAVARRRRRERRAGASPLG